MAAPDVQIVVKKGKIGRRRGRVWRRRRGSEESDILRSRIIIMGAGELEVVCAADIEIKVVPKQPCLFILA